MTQAPLQSRIVSVSEATGRGVAGLVRDAEGGEDVVVARHGRPVAAVVSIQRLEQLRTLEIELRNIALVLARAATDNGVRHSLDDVISAFGFDRAQLTEELEEERAGRQAGRA